MKRKPGRPDTGKSSPARKAWQERNREHLSKQTREWRKRNPVNALLTWSKSAAKKGGYVPILATKEELQNWLDHKPERCEACGKEGRLALDHCHVTGKVLGWLCWVCNTRVEVLRNPPEYLVQYAKRTAQCSR